MHEIAKREAELSNVTECAHMANAQVVKLDTRLQQMQIDYTEASNSRAVAERNVVELSRANASLETKLEACMHQVQGLLDHSDGAKNESIHLLASLANTTQQVSLTTSQADKLREQVRSMQESEEEYRGEIAAMAAINAQATAQMEKQKQRAENAEAEAANYKVAITNVSQQVSSLESDKDSLECRLSSHQAELKAKLEQASKDHAASTGGERLKRMAEDLGMFKARVNELTALLASRDKELREQLKNTGKLESLSSRLEETSRAKDRMAADLRQAESKIRQACNPEKGTPGKDVEHDLLSQVSMLQEELRLSNEALVQAQETSKQQPTAVAMGRPLENGEALLRCQQLVQENEELLKELMSCGSVIEALRGEIASLQTGGESVHQSMDESLTGRESGLERDMIEEEPLILGGGGSFVGEIELSAVYGDRVSLSWEGDASYDVHIKPGGAGTQTEQDTGAYRLIEKIPAVGESTEQEVFERLHEYMVKRMSTVQSVFFEFDKDRSGYIDSKEFQGAMKKLGVPLSTREVGTVLCTIDENHDGRIEYRELANTVKRYARGHPEACTKVRRVSVVVPKLAAGKDYAVRITSVQDKIRKEVEFTTLAPLEAAKKESKSHHLNPRNKGSTKVLQARNLEDPLKLEKIIDKLMEGNIKKLHASFTGLDKGAVQKVGAGSYQLGSKKISVSIMEDILMVRVGGGFQDWNQFIGSHQSYLRSYIMTDKSRETENARPGGIMGGWAA